LKGPTADLQPVATGVTLHGSTHKNMFSITAWLLVKLLPLLLLFACTAPNRQHTAQQCCSTAVLFLS
jgi:hypothetical protein